MAQQTDPKFEQLKLKYQSAINFAKQAGVRLAHVHMENGKLFIQGAAPSQEVKNRVWDQIKLVDSSYSDLTADITVDASLAPQQQAGQGQGGAQTGAAAAQTYRVQPGDTLSKIAKQFYGDASQYMRIFEANRDKLSDPNKIQVGQELKIPGQAAGIS